MVKWKLELHQFTFIPAYVDDIAVLSRVHTKFRVFKIMISSERFLSTEDRHVLVDSLTAFFVRQRTEVTTDMIGYTIQYSVIVSDHKSNEYDFFCVLYSVYWVLYVKEGRLLFT